MIHVVKQKACRFAAGPTSSVHSGKPELGSVVSSAC
jgi:hypothetical protein